jgi:hypothetical protein
MKRNLFALLAAVMLASLASACGTPVNGATVEGVNIKITVEWPGESISGDEWDAATFTGKFTLGEDGSITVALGSSTLDYKTVTVNGTPVGCTKQPNAPKYQCDGGEYRFWVTIESSLGNKDEYQDETEADNVHFVP